MKLSRVLIILVLLAVALVALPALMLAQTPEGDQDTASAPTLSQPAGMAGEWFYGPEFPFWGGNGIARFSGYYWPDTERVYFLGGRLEDDSTTGMVIEFDPATETYADTGAVMQTPVSNYYIDRLNIDAADQLCLSMGRLSTGAMYTSTQCYNPATNTTTEYVDASFTGAPRLAGGQAVVNDVLYMFGGFDGAVMFDDTWTFDPSLPAGSRWTDLGCPLSSARAYMGVAVIGDLIYAIGGDTWEGGSLVPQAVTEVFDTNDPGSCWQDALMADLPPGSESGDWPAVYVDGPYALAGNIYVTGGIWPTPVDYFFQYDPGSDTWDTTLQSINQIRRNHAMVFVPPLGANPPRIWIFGGYDGSATNAMTASSEYFEAMPLALTPAEQTIDGVPCTWVTATLNLANGTGITDTFSVTYSGNTWEVQGPAQLGPIADGSSLDFTVAISVPCDMECFQEDTVLIEVEADSNPAMNDAATVTATSGGATVEGHVFDANFPSEGIFGAFLDLEDMYDEDIYFDDYTDLSGYYAFTDIPTGTYVFEEVAAIGYDPILTGIVDIGIDDCLITRDFTLTASMVEIEPDSLSEEVAADSQVQAMLTLSNPGTADLLFHIEEIGADSPFPVPETTAIPAGPPHVDPQIYEEMAASPDGRARFLVVMKEQADLSAAYSIPDWTARGQYVYNTLKATMEASQADLRLELSARDISYKPVLVNNGLWIEAGNLVLDSIATRGDVAYVMANRTMEVLPVEDQSILQPNPIDWNLQLARAPEVWDAGYTGEGIIVANIDTGVWYTHDALRTEYRGYDEGSYNHDFNWYHPTSPDGCDGSTQPCDNDGHGTSTMGIMVGDDGAAELIGMAPGAQWIACKGCEGRGCSTEALLGCADWMLAPCPLGTAPGDPACDPAMRPHIVNNSWGGDSEDGWYFPAVAAWRAAGIFPSFANGNGGPECSTAHSPGDYYNAFSSGAIHYEEPDTYEIAGYSSRGPSLNYGLLKPNIAAPADPVHTATSGDDSNYTNAFNGTSSATPHTSGQVALIWSAQPELIGQIEMTEWLIMDTAVPITTTQDCGGLTDTVPNNVWGYGIIDAYEAVTKAVQSEWGISWLSVETESNTVAPDETGTLTVTFDSTGLTAGECYSATLKIETNSPYASDWPTMSLDIFVPVKLCVEGGEEQYFIYLPIVLKDY